MTESLFSILPDDVVLNIFFKLQDDPRIWARLACVCTKFSSTIRNICWKTQCYATIPSIVSDLLLSSSDDGDPPGGWSSLHKLAVCCPGILHAGVLLDNSDFGLDRELGPNRSYITPDPDRRPCSTSSGSGCGGSDRGLSLHADPVRISDDRDRISTVPARGPFSSSEGGGGSDVVWSLYDDLYYDTVYDPRDTAAAENDGVTTAAGEEEIEIKPGSEISARKRRKICRRSMRSHLASGVWNLSREQGNKLLASRFRGDCLYICDWPGCVHREEKRNYMLFRGVFKNFKRSRVWRTINDGNRSKIDIGCAFCSCKETWDLHSAFCLRRVFGFHDDGEPVVRAYVCENGHVSGAWTDLPLYT